MFKKKKKKILFVCLGNICRAPLAKAMMEKIIKEANLEKKYSVSSAGLGKWHIGFRFDVRTVMVGIENGLDMSGTVELFDIEIAKKCDYVFAMDRQVEYKLEKMQVIDNVRLFRFLDTVLDSSDTPDPYFGELSDFEDCLKIIKRNCYILLDFIKKNDGVV